MCNSGNSMRFSLLLHAMTIYYSIAGKLSFPHSFIHRMPFCPPAHPYFSVFIYSGARYIYTHTHIISILTQWKRKCFCYCYQCCYDNEVEKNSILFSFNQTVPWSVTWKIRLGALKWFFLSYDLFHKVTFLVICYR